MQDAFLCIRSCVGIPDGEHGIPPAASLYIVVVFDIYFCTSFEGTFLLAFVIPGSISLYERSTSGRGQHLRHHLGNAHHRTVAQPRQIVGHPNGYDQRQHEGQRLQAISSTGRLHETLLYPQRSCIVRYANRLHKTSLTPPTLASSCPPLFFHYLTPLLQELGKRLLSKLKKSKLCGWLFIGTAQEVADEHREMITQVSRLPYCSGKIGGLHSVVVYKDSGGKYCGGRQEMTHLTRGDISNTFEVHEFRGSCNNHDNIELAHFLVPYIPP